jgi:lysophospholipase L1-like esterase
MFYKKVTKKNIYLCFVNKKYFILVGVAVAVAGGTALAIYFIRKKYGTAPKIKKPKSILIVGDSQVAIRNASGTPITFTYPNYVISELAKRGIEVEVEALGGKRTSWMKERLAAKLASKKYDRVYLHGGGNDAFNSSINLNDTVQNFQDMVNMSRSAGADPFIVLGYRIDNFSDYRKMPYTQYVTDLRQYIPLIERRKILQKNLQNVIKGASFVPVYDIGGMTGDGIHPNAQAHRIIAEKILNTV